MRELARELGARRVILDGEIVAFDEQGRPSFERLQSRMHLASDSAVRRRMRDTPVTYVVFDLLYLDGHSTMPLRYEQRRELLEALELEGPAWRAPAYHRGEGSALLEATRELGIEGIVAKRLDSTYEPGRRSSGWVKVKNVCEQDVVIGGWTPGEGGRSDRSARSRSASTRTASSSTPARSAPASPSRRSRCCSASWSRCGAPDSPFDGRQPPKGTIFVEPRLVARVELREWTRSGTMRAPSFKGLRDDMDPQECVREEGQDQGRSKFGGMPRAIWSGAISFGLVNIPVKLYSAVSKKTVRFHQIDAESGGRVRQKRVGPDGEEIPYEQIVKGYEIGPDRYVTITPEELESLEPQKTRTIDIEDFVDLEQIDPIYYDHPYYLAPDTGAAKAYQLLVDAMEDSGKVAIARVVIRSKEHLVAIRPRDGALAMETMLFADEVVPTDSLEELAAADGDVKTSDRELDDGEPADRLARRRTSSPRSTATSTASACST